jgi:Ca-activated chloride channel family protein
MRAPVTALGISDIPMTFANGSALLLLILLPSAIGLFLWRSRVRIAAMHAVGELVLTRELFAHVSSSQRRWKFALWLAALTAVIVALARPIWGIEMDVIQTEGVSVMVVLDVSNSMNAQDVLPSRIERAKLAIHDILDELAGNELGLILFAGEAFTQFPFTTDTFSAASFLNSVTTNAITRQGTAIESALRLAVDAFQNKSGTEEFIILITDGENLEGDPLPVANEAGQRGITIHAIGYGDPVDGAPVPVLDEAGNIADFKKDRFGQVVVSRLDETILQEIAEQTGGLYQRASPGGIEIVNLINRINEAEAGELGSRTESHGVERFGIFVALALLALSLEILLPETRVEVVT